MEKIVSLSLVGISVLVLSGCGPDPDPDVLPAVDAYYLVDSYGYGVSGVEYDCASGEYGYTDFDGIYYFDAYGDSCDFYLDGINDTLHIEDGDYYGVNGLPYECDYTIGYTGDYGVSGSFEHEWYAIDRCTIDH